MVRNQAEEQDKAAYQKPRKVKPVRKDHADAGVQGTEDDHLSNQEQCDGTCGVLEKGDTQGIRTLEKQGIQERLECIVDPGKSLMGFIVHVISEDAGIICQESRKP